MQDNTYNPIQNSGQESEYRNLDNNNRPKIPPKIITIAAISFVAIIVVVSLILFRGGAGQNLDNTEPSIEYAGTDSKIAGIQFLINEGVTREQYIDIYNKLTKFADEKFPNAKYLNYVEGSLTNEKKEEGEEESSLTPEEEAALLALIAAAADSEETPPEMYSEEREDDGAGNMILVFDMVTDNDETVKVKIDPTNSIKEAKVGIYSSDEGEKLN